MEANAYIAPAILSSCGAVHGTNGTKHAKRERRRREKILESVEIYLFIANLASTLYQRSKGCSIHSKGVIVSWNAEGGTKVVAN